MITFDFFTENLIRELEKNSRQKKSLRILPAFDIDDFDIKLL